MSQNKLLINESAVLKESSHEFGLRKVHIMDSGYGFKCWVRSHVEGAVASVLMPDLLRVAGRNGVVRCLSDDDAEAEIAEDQAHKQRMQTRSDTVADVKGVAKDLLQKASDAQQVMQKASDAQQVMHSKWCKKQVMHRK